jgi:hypothetical protein
MAYHVLVQSVLNTSSEPVAIIPLHTSMLGNFDGQQDGTNRLIYSRFLVPSLMEFKGWAIFCDSDMLVRSDIAKLWALRDDSKAVLVCKHDYKTKHPIKARGTFLESKNEDYPRKNYSSLVLWNCGHPMNRIVTRQFAAESGGRILHRFSWLPDDLIGSIPLSWNWLVGEYEFNSEANLAHYTIGVPGFELYKHCDYSAEWFETLADVNHVGELKDKRRRA